MGNAWHLIPEAGPDAEVTVRFEKLVAKNVAEVTWHKTQRLQWREDGRLDFHVTVSGIHEISWWILGYGDQAEVLAPPSLRKLVAQRGRQLLSRYPEADDETAGPAAADGKTIKVTRQGKTTGRAGGAKRRPPEAKRKTPRRARRA